LTQVAKREKQKLGFSIQQRVIAAMLVIGIGASLAFTYL